MIDCRAKELYNINKGTNKTGCPNKKLYKTERIKTMKKLLSFALVLLTALSFCVPVCAADNGGVLIATDFKDRKAHFVPLDLNLASANIVTVDGNECLYIATRNTGANNWLGFPVPQTLEKETDYVFAFDVAVPQLSDGTKTGSVKMYWNVITGRGCGQVHKRRYTESRYRQGRCPGRNLEAR